MTIIYIVAGIILIVLFTNYYQKRKESNSPYYMIRKKLKEDFELSSFSSDWKRKQELNLQLLWLDTVKEIETMDYFGNNKEVSENSILSKLNEEQLKFPTKWKLDDLYHFPFVQGIISGYGKTLAENDYKGIYKPNNILPYPKGIIKKAYYYIFDYLNYDKPFYKLEEKKKYAENLNGIKVILDFNFVDTGGDDLPKEPLENLTVGEKYYKKQPISNEVDELLMIDWLDSNGWILKGARYTESNQFDFAILCYMRSLDIEPENTKTLHCLGLSYHHKKEYQKAIEHFNRALIFKPKDKEIIYCLANTYLHSENFEEAIKNYKKVIELDPKHGSAYNNIAVAYSEINKPELELKYMIIAAQLGVEKAIHWTTQNKVSIKQEKKTPSIENHQTNGLKVSNPPLRFSRTKTTPEVILDSEGYIKIKGKSIPEDPLLFFKPLKNWVTEYIEHPAEITCVDFILENINGDSVKYFHTLFQILSYVKLRNKKLIINWYYNEEEDDMIEYGKSFSSDIGVPFNFIRLS